MDFWTTPGRRLQAVSCVVILLFSMQLLVAAQVINIQVNRQDDETHFEGQVFRRLCSVYMNPPSTDPNNQVMADFEWLRDGVVLSSGRGVNLQLHLSSLEMSDAGHYTCRATLDDNTVHGPISGGRVTVLDRSPIHVPTTQYIIYGSDSSLNCSYSGEYDAFPTWKKNNTLHTGRFSAASVADEGLYTCDLFVPDNSASIAINVTVIVVVPISISSRPMAFHEIRGNGAEMFEVQFEGRRELNLTVTWYRNGTRLSQELERRIVTTEYGTINGTTGLSFDPIIRADQGVYRVVVRSDIDTVPESLVVDEFSFQIDIIVPPTPPTNLRVTGSTSLTADLLWTLTNQTADQGGDVLVLNVTFANNTQAVDIITLPGGQTSFRLEDLIPGTEYIVFLSAVNEDATVSSPPLRVTTLIGVPKVNEVLIERVNETFFGATVSLAYTGGGPITHFEISYKTVGSISWIPLPTTTEASSSSRTSLVWSGLFEVPDEDVALGVVDFQLRVVNDYGLKSQIKLSRAPKFVESTTVITTDPITIDDERPLPLWIIIVAVAVGSVIVTVVTMICIIVTIYLCRRRQRKKHQYKVNIPTSNLNNSMEKELDTDNSMVTRHTNQDRNMMMASRATSTSSSSLSKKSLTPIPTSAEDNKYFKVHLRSPSDASSITAKHTPSTTASSSPANMKAQYKIQMQNENLQDLPETINIHDERIMRQVEAAESQCSETESESQTNRIQNQRNIEMNRRGYDSTSGPGASLPSSVQSSHQSIPSGVSIPSISHSHQSLPSSSSTINGGYHPLHSSSQRIVMRPHGAPLDGHNDVGITRITMPGSHHTAGGAGGGTFIEV